MVTLVDNEGVVTTIAAGKTAIAVSIKDDKGNIYRNWRKLLEELDYYLNEPSSKYTKEAKERNGIMKIDNLQLV